MIVWPEARVQPVREQIAETPHVTPSAPAPLAILLDTVPEAPLPPKTNSEPVAAAIVVKLPVIPSASDQPPVAASAPETPSPVRDGDFLEPASSVVKRNTKQVQTAKAETAAKPELKIAATTSQPRAAASLGVPLVSSPAKALTAIPEVSKVPSTNSKTNIVVSIAGGTHKIEPKSMVVAAMQANTSASSSVAPATTKTVASKPEALKNVNANSKTSEIIPFAGGSHKVEPNETLSQIALKYYGHSGPKTLARIMAANKGLEANKIRSGQELTLPATN